MERNIILAGVGGQGILTIAHVISTAAMRRGWHVKQAEVHGMSQRGGAVYSHLRLADHPIYCDLIPVGECDVIVAMEPLEGLRYVHYLRPDGAILSNITPVMNIVDYPLLDEVLEKIAAISEHVLIDADRLARSVGAGLGANSALLGGMAAYLDLPAAELEDVLSSQLVSKGQRVVDSNRKAFLVGGYAAAGYRDRLARGAMRSELREWVRKVSADGLLSDHRPEANAKLMAGAHHSTLSEPSRSAIGALLSGIARQDRTQLREHEVYRIMELIGAVAPPRHVFIPAGATLDPHLLAEFSGEKIVLKVVSPQVVHKSDWGGVRIIHKSIELVRHELRRLSEQAAKDATAIDGVLLVEFVEHEDAGFGNELFVGIRASREFGPVIVAGVGGVDTEYLAERMRPGAAAAKALAVDVSAEEFLDLFRTTAAYDTVAGLARGHRRVVCDGELLRCFRAFIGLAREFCMVHEDGGVGLAELEVNPFAFVRQRMIPLDGRGTLGVQPPPQPPRPAASIRALLEPQSIALIGASGQRMNFARIILNNIIESGFPIENLHVVHPEANAIDGVRCIRSIKFTSEPIDMLVAATPADRTVGVIADSIDSGRVKSIILIPGGLGETEGSAATQDQIRSLLGQARRRPDGGPVILGGNCLGVRSRPGLYDTFFIPPEKLQPRREQPAGPTALVTQSGAFAITRLSNLESINPAITVTLGNQTDLTVSDMTRAVGEREDIGVIGVYVEGFNVLDGLEFVRVVEDVTAAGKLVIFYKAGRTAPGRSATAGHTASIAGDYDVCQAAVAKAGAIVVDTFKEFEQILELATLFRGKVVGGRRIGTISNAGVEAVGMADAIQGPRYQVEMATLAEPTLRRIQQVLSVAKLDKLVTAKNPLDVNPMAGEDVYEEAILAMLDDPGVDGVVASIVPFTPHLSTTPAEISNPKSLASRIPQIFRSSRKPLVMVLDAGPPYDVLIRTLRRAGVPVFPSCDQAIRSFGRYLDHCAGRRT